MVYKCATDLWGGITRVSSRFLLKFSQLNSVVIPDGANAKKGNKAAWPILENASIAQVEIPVGKWRAPHYHTNTPEIAVIVRGKALAAIQDPQAGLETCEVGEGECVYFPLGWTHWLKNIGDVPLVAYFNYSHESPVTQEVSNLMADLRTADGVSIDQLQRSAHTE